MWQVACLRSRAHASPAARPAPPRRICHDNLAALDAFFASPAGRAFFTGWERPKGSSIAFPLLAGGESAEDFCARVLEATGVLLLPGTKFVEGTEDCARRVRFGFGRRNMPKVLALLEAFLLKELTEARRQKERANSRKEGGKWACW